MKRVLFMSPRGTKPQFHVNIVRKIWEHNHSQIRTILIKPGDVRRQPIAIEPGNAKSGHSIPGKKTTQPLQKISRPVIPKLMGSVPDHDPRKIVLRPNHVKFKSGRSSSPPKKFTPNPLSARSKTFTPNPLGSNGVVKNARNGVKIRIGDGLAPSYEVFYKFFNEESSVPQHQILPDVLWPGDTQVLQRPRGGQISYSRGGRAKEEGPVMVFFHGTPGCRLDSWAHKYCEQHGIRMFCFDRPGYGYTSHKAEDDMMDFIKDVEQVLNHHGVRRFTIFAASGGGPYALAAADYFPKNRLGRTAIMCGMTDPSYEQISVRTSWRLQRFAYAYFPTLSEAWADRRGIGRFNRDPKLSDKEIDRKLRIWREEHRQGLKGYVNDFRLAGSSWKFNWKGINSNPIKWYHGGLDTNCTLSAAQAMKNAMTTSVLQLTAFPMHDHFTIQHNETYKLVDWLRGQR